VQGEGEPAGKIFRKGHGVGRDNFMRPGNDLHGQTMMEIRRCRGRLRQEPGKDENDEEMEFFHGDRH